MASVDSLKVRSLLAKGVVRQVLLDNAIGLRLRYIGTSTVTTVAIVQADSLILTTAAVTDTFLFDGAGSYSTLGALSDAINATGRWESVVMDALRSEDPDDFFVASADLASTKDENDVVCYDLKIDTSAAATMAVCLSPLSPNFDMPEGHRVHLKQIDYSVDNTEAAATLKIYKRNGTIETLIYSATNVGDGTATSVTFASGNAKITGGVDEELIVFFDGTVADAATVYVRVIGLYE